MKPEPADRERSRLEVAGQLIEQRFRLRRGDFVLNRHVRPPTGAVLRGQRSCEMLGDPVAYRLQRFALDAVRNAAAHHDRPLAMPALSLHRYLGGPWESLGRFAFRGL